MDSYPQDPFIIHIDADKISARVWAYIPAPHETGDAEYYTIAYWDFETGQPIEDGFLPDQPTCEFPMLSTPVLTQCCFSASIVYEYGNVRQHLVEAFECSANELMGQALIRIEDTSHGTFRSMSDAWGVFHTMQGNHNTEVRDYVFQLLNRQEI